MISDMGIDMWGMECGWKIKFDFQEFCAICRKRFQFSSLAYCLKIYLISKYSFLIWFKHTQNFRMIHLIFITTLISFSTFSFQFQWLRFNIRRKFYLNFITKSTHEILMRYVETWNFREIQNKVGGVHTRTVFIAKRGC